VSLNNKRRIFRPSFSLGRTVLRLVASVRLVTLMAIGLAGSGGAGWMLWRPAEAPPAQPRVERMVADVARVAVVDGNTLRLADRVVRLDGVVSPERGETCQNRDGLSFDCGVAAANALAALLRQGTVDCTPVGTDRMGRARATCSAGGAQLNHAVVAQGWARAGDDTLASAEETARAQQRGLWALAR